MKFKQTAIMLGYGAILFSLILMCADPSGTPFDKPQISYKTIDRVYKIGDSIPVESPELKGKDPFYFAIDSSVPTGLTFDTLTGVISGAPKDTQSKKMYTITVTNSSGSAEIEISITVLPLPPTDLLYDIDTAVYRLKTPIFENSPSWNGGNPTKFVSSPALPSGLSIDVLKGTIYGTPLIISKRAIYTITASNAGGSTTAKIIISVDSLVAPDTTVQVVSGLKVVRIDSTKVQITWEKSNNADSYLLYRSVKDKSSAYQLIKSTSETAFSDSIRFNHFYFVQARRSTYGSKSSDTVETLDTLHIRPINHPPVIISDLKNRSIKVNELDTILIVISHADTGQVVTVKISNLDSLRKLFGADSVKAIDWKPKTDTSRLIFAPGSKSGAYKFLISVSDGIDSINASVSEFVGNVNHPPEWTKMTYYASVNDGETWSFKLKDSCADPDSGVVLKFRFIADSAKCTLLKDSLFTFAAGMLDSTIHTIKIEASDGTLFDTATIIISITPVFYNLTTVAQNGSISILPSKTKFRMSEKVMLTGIPAAGYEFAGWTESVTSNSNPVQLTFDSNKSITANFRRYNPADCITIDPGSSINDKIKELSAVPGASTICPTPGLYDARSIGVEGTVKIEVNSGL